jgi:hypothetical protein
MALDQAKRFEDELQLLFQATGRVDVWNKIKARAEAMDVEAAHEARKEKAAEKKRQEEVDEIITILLILLVTCTVLGATGWFVYEAMQQCAGKCGFQQ